METKILDGRIVAKHITEKLIDRVKDLKEKGVTPCLVTILVGDDPSSETYNWEESELKPTLFKEELEN